MEPTFKSGDIVLVRKSDTPLVKRPDSRNDKDLNAVRFNEARLGISGDLLISKPPLVTKGDVVVFHSPSDPRETCIKRVIGLGGQHVQPPERFRHTEVIPKYSLWVEGDLAANSQDSRHYGPISKKLLLGKAELIVWPPARWGKVATKEISEGRAWWYGKVER